MSYVKLSDLEFAKPEHRAVCEELYRDIQSVEAKLASDELLAESIRDAAGNVVAESITSHFVMFNKRVLMGLKIAFWYYTGKAPAQVVGDMNEEDEVDIFNP
jgi:hypothetical protein